MLQTWEYLTFLHWPYRPRDIRSLVPPELSLHLFDGAAWVSLTPFLLSNLRLPFLPPVPWISRFPETNVRTYVQAANGEPGIWFFTLDAARLAAVAGARISYWLPYRWTKMRVAIKPGRIEYSSSRYRISILPGEPLLAGALENFLTARFRLYTRAFGRLAFADIEHPPWKLQTAALAALDQNIVQASGPPSPSGDPLLHFSRRTDVRIGRLQFYR
jgi:uncharacterized protein YqjF (DUF2071 family)